MLDTEFVHETGREYTRSEGTAEDIWKLGIQTSYTHILELEVGSKDSIRWSPNSQAIRAWATERSK